MDDLDGKITPDLDAFIVGFGDSPEDYSQDEKGQLFMLIKKMDQNLREFVSVLIGPDADIIMGKRYNRKDAYTFLLNRYDQTGFYFDDAKLVNFIHEFRYKARIEVGEVNSIRKQAAKRKYGIIEYSTNVDEIFKLGSMPWLFEKVYFNLCNHILECIESKEQ